MARRATYLDAFREAHPDSLVLGGGYEFINAANDVPGLQQLTALDTSYALLDYDLLRLTPREKVFLLRAGLEVQEDWTAPEGLEYRQFDVGGRTVGVLLFPMLAEGVDQAPDAMADALADAVAERLDQVDLLVGLSPWGYMAERAYLDSGRAAPDVLFGTGPGPGIRGTATDHPRTYWIRPYPRGKALNQLDILALPVRTNDFAWEETVNLRSSVVGLDTTYQERPDLVEIIY